MTESSTDFPGEQLPGAEVVSEGTVQEPRSFELIVRDWEKLSSDQVQPSQGNVAPPGTPYESLSDDGYQAVSSEASDFDDARRSALARIGRTASVGRFTNRD